MIRPQCCSFMWGRHSRIRRTAARNLRSRSCCQSSSLDASNGRPAEVPALLTRMSTGPTAATASATNVTLSENGWKTFFRGINNDDVEGESLARHLTGTLMRKRVCVISDNGESAAGLARAVTQGLGSAAVESCSSITPTGTVDIPARVADITKAGADGVRISSVYGVGYRLERV